MKMEKKKKKHVSPQWKRPTDTGSGHNHQWKIEPSNFTWSEEREVFYEARIQVVLLLRDAISYTNKVLNIFRVPPVHETTFWFVYNCKNEADWVSCFVSTLLVSAIDLSASLVFLKSNLENACILDKRRTFGERKFIIRYLEVC